MEPSSLGWTGVQSEKGLYSRERDLKTGRGGYVGLTKKTGSSLYAHSVTSPLIPLTPTSLKVIPVLTCFCFADNSGGDGPEPRPGSGWWG